MMGNLGGEHQINPLTRFSFKVAAQRNNETHQFKPQLEKCFSALVLRTTFPEAAQDFVKPAFAMCSVFAFNVPLADDYSSDVANMDL